MSNNLHSYRTSNRRSLFNGCSVCNMTSDDIFRDPKLGELMDEEAEVSVDTMAEFKAVDDMIHAAKKQGLLTEVIWTLAQSNHGGVVEKCYHALNEWDC